MNNSDIKILVVDDVADNVKIVLSILKEESYSLSFAFSGQSALEQAQLEAFDLILLDIMMPNMDGFEVCKQLKQSSLNHLTPVIFLSARADVESIAKGFELGGVDYVVKPFHPDEILARVNTHVSLALANRRLEANFQALSTKSKLQHQRLLDEIETSQREMIYVLMEMMEMSSDETGQHIRRVAEISRQLAHQLDYLTIEDETLLFHAAPMHDIGKMAIPREILHKPGPLSDEEFEVVKAHTSRAADFFPKSRRRLIRAAAQIAEQHHEHWDGKGYPKGLVGEEIHIYGRIVALADSFDSLTHNRCYRPAWTVERALDYIKQQRGLKFDPQLVDILLANAELFSAIVEDSND